MSKKLLAAVCGLFLLPSLVVASTGGERLDLTNHVVGYLAIAIFVLAYAAVMAEESIHLRKSKPVLIAAGLIWFLIAGVYAVHDQQHLVETAIRHNLLEFAELMLFLLVAMTYINAMEERGLFNALRGWLIGRKMGFRSLFWMTGILAFFISPVADNLTTALVMCAVVMAVAGGNAKFVNLACINIVVAANAGGAFSPFGDITTLMVWQKGVISFGEFFELFIPSVVNYLVPAVVMFMFVPNELPLVQDEFVHVRPGAYAIVALFFVTILTAVLGHSYLGLPPVIGMMFGLGYLKMFGFYLQVTHRKSVYKIKRAHRHEPKMVAAVEQMGPFDIFSKIARAEWDTLMFFYGVVMCVGGLSMLGYLAAMSEALYVNLNHTIANSIIGVLSAIVDNIPVMFAVLTMMPDMSHGQWLLVTLTAGVGGSMLSIGSAAGVALMGQARGMYTFMGHLRWTPVIALGYVASILTHLWLNAASFNLH